MKNHFETEAFTLSVKEFKYSKGTGYNFSFTMQGDAQSEDRGSAPVIWISAVSFTEPILDKRNYLLRGKLQVKPPYKDYPAGLQLVVNEAILLEPDMYLVARKRPKPEDAPQGANAPVNASTQGQSVSDVPDFPEQSEVVPF